MNHLSSKSKLAKRLSKSDFMVYLNCPRCLWIKKNQPASVPKLSDYDQFIVDQGYEVEALAQELFQGEGVDFQFTIEKDRLFARADVIEKNKDGSLHLYEIKSAGRLDPSKIRQFSYDLAFQKYVFERAGYEIASTKVVTPNPDYRRPDAKDVIVEDFFLITDLSDEVDNLDLKLDIENALAVMSKDSKGLVPTNCSLNTSLCAEECKDQLPDFSIYKLLSRSIGKVHELEDLGIYDVHDIPSDFALTDNQQIHYLACVHGSPIVDKDQISAFLEEHIVYPLYFLDYESINLAIPRYVGHKPFQQIVFQFSLHIQESPSAPLVHHEFLALDVERDPCIQVAEALEEVVTLAPEGTFLVWHKSFEQGRNEEMAELSPRHAEMFSAMNRNLCDLKEVFSKNMYVDCGFKASASIKKVLPVLCPDLSYKDLEIQNGTSASLAWCKDVLLGGGKEKKKLAKREQLAKNLLEYCGMDTLAMYEILERLKGLG